MSSHADLSPVESIDRAVFYLTRAQHESGSWTDFWLPVGTSDSWVTAYVGFALRSVASCAALPARVRVRADEASNRAADWLLARRRLLHGWGYNGTVPPDADSTAHAVSLLARLGHPVPQDAIAFLQRHYVPGSGYRTYSWRDPSHQWVHPSADITAAVLRALYDACVIDRATLAGEWLTLLGNRQRPDGMWDGYWWETPHFPTAIVLETWDLAGRPSNPRLPDGLADDEHAFAGACSLTIRTMLPAGLDPAPARCLVAKQDADGGWPSAPILRLPPSHVANPRQHQIIFGTDARRLFTTATAAHALSHWLGQSEALFLEAMAPDGEQRRGQRRVKSRSAIGAEADALVGETAAAIGFDNHEIADAVAMFRSLTRESLAAPCPWPSTQLSSLSGGMPLEFSVAVGRDERTALRFAAEIGDPWLRPYERARSAERALAKAAERLGYSTAWARVLPALRPLVSSATAAPDGLRFWVWGGVDHLRREDGQPGLIALLKVYVNLLHREVGGARARLEAALLAADIPMSERLCAILDLLDSQGFLHEVGFGMGPDGRTACKVYYELAGWQRDLVGQICARAELPERPDLVCPEIPGILRESLARKIRAGIALRIDPSTGRVCELSTAAAFPPPLLPDREVRQRVRTWLTSSGWDTKAYEDVSEFLLPAWEEGSRFSGQLHSLFTRSICADGNSTTIYLRPNFRPSSSTVGTRTRPDSFAIAETARSRTS